MSEFEVKEKPKYDGSFNSMVACLATRLGASLELVRKDESYDIRSYMICYAKGVSDGKKLNIWSKEDFNRVNIALSNENPSVTSYMAGRLKKYLKNRQEDKLDIFERYYEFGQKHPEFWQESLL